MMNKMVVANLAHRPTRSLIANIDLKLFPLSLFVADSLAEAQMDNGLLNGSKESQVGVGADLMVLPPGASALIAMSGAPIPVKVGGVLRRMPHVVAVAPVIWAFSQQPLEIVYGIDLATYDRLPPPFRYLSGGPKAEGRASVFYLKLDDVASAGDVEAEIKATPGMERYSVRSMQEYLSMMTPDKLPGFELAIQIVVGVAVVVGFLVMINLAKVLASLNTTCPHCDYEIPPSELRRADTENVICPKCSSIFIPVAKRS